MTDDLVCVPKHVHIGAAWAGITVFSAVRRAFPEVTPREVFRKARSGEVLRNERSCHPMEPLASGDVVTVALSRPARPSLASPHRRDAPVDTPAGPFWVVWEDDDLLAAGKPARCASHPALKHSGDTLLDRVRAHLGVGAEDPFQPALANRLDIDTSGLVLVAKSRSAQRRLGRHFQKGLVQKTYLALVVGWPEPDQGEIRRPLVKRPDSRDLGRLPPGHRRLAGVLQEAATRYRTLERLEQPLRSALLEVELLTGRTHQIRRHLAGEGTPVAGDRRYGDRDFNADFEDVGDLARMFLHAWRVRLPHPRTGQPLELTAPLPADLGRCLRSLGGGTPDSGAGGPRSPSETF